MPAIETAEAFTPQPTPPGRSPVRNRHREPRKTPGFQRLHRRTPGHADWLAEGSVSSEPVSPRNIGNLAILSAQTSSRRAKTLEILRISKVNSLSGRTGNFSHVSGKKSEGSGYFR